MKINPSQSPHTYSPQEPKTKGSSLNPLVIKALTLTSTQPRSLTGRVTKTPTSTPQAVRILNLSGLKRPVR